MLLRGLNFMWAKKDDDIGKNNHPTWTIQWPSERPPSSTSTGQGYPPGSSSTSSPSWTRSRTQQHSAGRWWSPTLSTWRSISSPCRPPLLSCVGNQPCESKFSAFFSTKTRDKVDFCLTATQPSSKKDYIFLYNWLIKLHMRLFLLPFTSCAVKFTEKIFQCDAGLNLWAILKLSRAKPDNFMLMHLN